MVVAQGWEELWILYVVAFALGIGETLFDTAAQSVMPGIVDDPDGLARANGRLYAVELTANQFVGPPLGGLLAALALAAALFASSGAYLLAVVALVRHERALPARAHRSRPRRSAPTSRRASRYLVGHRVLRTLAICVGHLQPGLHGAVRDLPALRRRPGPDGPRRGRLRRSS